MADKRISDLPAATQWHPDAFIPQDNPAGLTEKVTPAQVEAKLEADGFVKAASPSLGQVAAYTAGGWAPIKLADANIDAAAAIGWGKISKTGAVASDVGALPTDNPTPTGTLTAPDVIGGLARMQASAVSPSNQAWFGYTGLNSAGAYVGYYPGLDGAVRIAAASGKTVSIGTGAAYGQLVISDSGVASSSLAGTGTRAVAADSTGKLTAQPTIALDVGASTTGTGEQTLFTGSYAPSKAEVSVRGYTGGESGTYTIRVKDNGNLIIEESFTESSQFVIRFSTSTATDCIYDMISGPNSGPFSAKIGYVAIGAMPNGSLTITGQSSTALDGIVLRQVITSQGG